MSLYKILDGGQVVNTIVADEQFMIDNYSEYELVVDEPGPPPPPKAPRKTRYEFRSRFTPTEKIAMYDSTDTIIRVFLDDIQSAEYIDLGLQETIDGVNYLESQGLIGAGRAAEILSGE
jgi:hypothetical protein